MLATHPLAIAANLCALGIPLLYLAVALWPGGSGSRSWSACLIAMATAFVAALLTTGLFIAASGTTLIGRLPLGNLDAGLWPSLRVDTLTAAMLLLITFVGGVILRFSRHYLAGDPSGVDPGQHRFRRWFCATLSCVATLVISNQLLLLALAWIGTSLCLHQLLVYYPDRPKAVLAAHKKFLISRLADVCLLAAVLILGWKAQSLQIDRALLLPGSLPQHGALTLATVLLAIAAILKCAQLPFHGWLIQVMEAPTPVSALLHAGIVNIGGFLMIRFAPLMAANETAQIVLTVVGALTAVSAALVMETRVSIKVMLAWSTCAQMGFMLLECGLGLYHLALLHLLAHSVYKAHRFLNSGQAVHTARQRAQSPSAVGASPSRLLNGALLLALGALALWLFPGPYNLAMETVLAVAVISLALEPVASRAPWRMLADGAGIIVLYSLASLVFARLLAPASHAIPPWMDIAVAALFLLSAVIIQLGRRGSTVIRRLYPYLYGGFYLDELFTRLTLWLWPPRLPKEHPGPPSSTPEPLEASS